jgi:hypothetical protein
MRGLSWLALLAMAQGLNGCEAHGAPQADADVRADAAQRCAISASVWPADDSVPPAFGTGRTLTYALWQIVVEGTPPDHLTPIAGFNLDGVYTDLDGIEGVCHRPDSPSALDCELNCPERAVTRSGGCAAPGCAPGLGCRGGVDNQLPSLLDAFDTLFPTVSGGSRAAVARAYRGGQTALIVQVSAVDSLEDDDLVRVRVLRAVPEFSAPCHASRADLPYATARRAVIDGDRARPVLADGVGRIRGGVLRAKFSGPIAVPFIDSGPRLIDWPIESARFAVNLSEAGGSRGNFGGAIQPEVLLRSFDAELISQSITIVSGFVDDPLSPGVCVDRASCPVRFGRISVGFNFSLTRAVLTDRVLDEPPAGACPTEPFSSPDAGTFARIDGGVCVPDARR